MSASPFLSKVWRASELGPAAGAAVRSGHSLLDVELPASGWPLGALIELLVFDPEAPWSSLLLPALVAHLRCQEGMLALLDPPFVPYVPVLMAAGIPASRILWLRSETAANALWLAGQAAGCADVAALLAWLPQARTGHLRRLHATARRRSQLLLFAFLDADGVAARAPSCAPLRLALQRERPLPHGQDLAPRLRVSILRRRGPPLERPLWLPVCNGMLDALLASPNEDLGNLPGAEVLVFPQPGEAGDAGGHALDCLARTG